MNFVKTLLCITLALAGCGDDGDSNDTGTTGTTGTTTSSDTGGADYWDDGACFGFWFASSADCKDVSFEGECDDEGHVIWCENESLYCIDCATLDATCEWVSELDWYNCVQSW